MEQVSEFVSMLEKASTYNKCYKCGCMQESLVTMNAQLIYSDNEHKDNINKLIDNFLLDFKEIEYS